MLRFVTRNKVSENGVGLALVSTDKFSVANNVSTFDLSYTIPENRLSNSNYFRLDGSIEYKFDHKNIKNLLLLNTTGLQSTNAVVTNKTAIRHNIGRSMPLFYKYHIGRGNKYVFHRPPVDSDEWRSLLVKIKQIEDGDETTLTEDEVQSYSTYIKDICLALRDNILITTRRGSRTNVVFDIGSIQPVTIDTASEYFGSIFDVEIYTSERCNNGLTLMVNYQSYKPDQNNVTPGASEVLNADPIYDIYDAVYSDTDQVPTAESDSSRQFTRKQYAVKFIMDE